MGARKPPKPGWVTVADAAAALTRAGDTIDASNVSRYLARNDDVPSEKHGKFRYVDLEALKAHRNSSLFVADKQLARETEPAQAMRTPVAVDVDDGGEDPGASAGSSALQATNLELKMIDLRRKRREEQVELGELVPVEELRTVLSATMGAMIAEMARQETVLTAKLGREAGVEIRKAFRAARSAASERLVLAAQQVLKPGAAEQLTPATDQEPAAA